MYISGTLVAMLQLTTSITAVKKVEEFMENNAARLVEMMELDLPSMEGEASFVPFRDAVASLRASYSQRELRNKMVAGLKVLDNHSIDDPEFEVLSEMLDSVWEALYEHERP